jgi:hypothetical protein
MDTLYNGSPIPLLTKGVSKLSSKLPNRIGSRTEPYRGVPEKCVITQADYSLTHKLGWKGFRGTNDLAYLAY